MRRPSYRFAIKWIAANDDNEWIYDDDSSLSMTANLVADIFQVPDEKVRRDLERVVRRWETIG